MKDDARKGMIAMIFINFIVVRINSINIIC